MDPLDPRHGSHAGWQAHKKDGEPVCDACDLGAYRYHKRKRARLATGVRSRVTLGDTAWRIIDENPRRALHLSTGLTVAKICTYHKGGPDTPVLQSTRDKIEAFTPRDVLTPIGIQRRIRALNRLGYSAAAIAAVASVNVESVKDARRDGHTPSFVKQAFAERIAGAYDRLSMTLPVPSRAVSKARGTAQRKGWAPPLAYDDIDDPAATPHTAQTKREKTDLDEVVVLRVMNGEHLPLTSAERTEVVTRLRARGMSYTGIERHTGITKIDRHVKKAAA